MLRALRANHTSSAVKPVLGQRTIPGATSESATFRPFVEDLIREYSRTGLLECVTMGAGFTSAADMRWLHEQGLGFIAALKGNQPRLLEGAHVFLGSDEQDPPHGWEHIAEADFGGTSPCDGALEGIARGWGEIVSYQTD